MRVGHGYDLHALAPGRRLVLGGVEIAHHQGLVAHSDGDVLLHAICDALLGAAGLGDIGEHFPDTDQAYAGISSRRLLRDVAQRVADAGFVVSNVDATIIAQAPRLASHRAAMISHIAADLQIAPGQVNVKATTTERLGVMGREEAIAAHAVCLLLAAR